MESKEGRGRGMGKEEAKKVIIREQGSFVA
jgi:hypothetical protein